MSTHGPDEHASIGVAPPKPEPRTRRDREALWRRGGFGIVAGPIAGEEGTISLSLSKISSAKEGWRMIAAKKGKPAITHWRKLMEHGGNTLLEFRPETGRTHQIRVHAALAFGHPLLGDPIYGTGKGAARTMLHAAGLIIPREGKEPVVAAAPLPADFAALGFGEG